jgi:hypothetical protein
MEKKTFYYVKSTEKGPEVVKITPHTYTMSIGGAGEIDIFETQEEALVHYEKTTLGQHAYHKAQAEFLMKNLKLLKEMKKDETQKEPPG